MKKIAFILPSLLLPFFALAQEPGTFDYVIWRVTVWIDLITPIIVALALLFFFYGLAMYILKQGEEKAKGKEIMIYGIIALFVMVAVWGLVSLLATSLGIESIGTQRVPGVDTTIQGGVGW